MATLVELRDHLQAKFKDMKGEWVDGKMRYEPDFSRVIEAEYEENRYWDCVWKDLKIELKMGKIWLDLVRYSEQLLKTSEESSQEVITLFLRYRKHEITHIYGVKTELLYDILNLDEDTAQRLLRINDQVPRSLNAQASLSVQDIAGITEFHVSSHRTLF